MQNRFSAVEGPGENAFVETNPCGDVSSRHSLSDRSAERFRNRNIAPVTDFSSDPYLFLRHPRFSFSEQVLEIDMRRRFMKEERRRMTKVPSHLTLFF